MGEQWASLDSEDPLFTRNWFEGLMLFPCFLCSHADVASGCKEAWKEEAVSQVMCHVFHMAPNAWNDRTPGTRSRPLTGTLTTTPSRDAAAATHGCLRSAYMNEADCFQIEVANGG